MRIAVVGSRNITVENIGEYISECDELVSGGAKGIDSCVSEYARKNGIKLTEFIPKYERYGKAAPIIRNKEIVNYSDEILIFWDGKSKGTLSVIRFAEKFEKKYRVILCK